MVGGPIGGFMSDKVHKSTAKHIRAGFLVCIVAMVAFLLVPHETLGQTGNWIIGAVCTLGFGAIVFTMRAVFFAPMDEVKVPTEITGAAMSLASLVIYLPNAFAYVMYGSFLDRYPGITGFRIVFCVMIAWAVIGLGKDYFMGSILGGLCYMVYFSCFHSLNICLIQNRPVAVVLAAVLVGTGYYLCIAHHSTGVSFDTLALILHRWNPRINVAAAMFVINLGVLAMGTMYYGLESVLYGIAFTAIQTLTLDIWMRLQGRRHAVP